MEYYKNLSTETLNVLIDGVLQVEQWKDIPNYENKKEVNHKGGNKKCNLFSELEWVSPSENIIHAISELKCKKRGKSLATLNGVIQTSIDGVFIKKWNNLSEVTNELGFNWSCLSRCCRNICKTSYGFKWKYA